MPFGAFFATFEKLCKNENKSLNAVAKELKISSGSITAWRNGVMPREKTLEKIANYFGVTVEYLLTGTQKSPPAVNTVEELIARECAGLSETDQQTVLDYIRFLKSKQ